MLTIVWHTELHRGRAGEFHSREMPAVVQPSVWWFEVERSALVLGSSQPIEHVDTQWCDHHDIDVVRRRSGGGAVLLQPADVLWADILIPSDHPLWTPDVSSSAQWVGEAWARALASLGHDGLSVHRGPMTHSTWSSRVCFAGRGAGEVMLGDQKVVGVSQRRVRQGARFQCALYSNWRPDAHVALFAAPGPSADDLDGLVATVNTPFELIRTALSQQLPVVAGGRG